MLQTSSTPPTPTFADELDAGFRAHLAAKGLRDTEPYHYNITYRDHPDGPLLGGLTAHTWGMYYNIDLLWLDPKTRGKRIGSTLIELADRVGVKRGCMKGAVWTFKYQAEGLYNKHGFVRNAEIPGWFHGKMSGISMVKESLRDPSTLVDEPLPLGFTITEGKDAAVGKFLHQGLNSDSEATLGPRTGESLYIAPSTPWTAERIPFGLAGLSFTGVLLIDQSWIDPAEYSGASKEEVEKLLLDAVMQEARRRKCTGILAMQTFNTEGTICLDAFIQAGFVKEATSTGWFGSLEKILLYQSMVYDE